MINILKSNVASFASNRCGNVAMIFALSALPLVFVVGGAVDYSRALDSAASLQAAVDAAALAGSKLSGDAQTTTIDNLVSATMGQTIFTASTPVISNPTASTFRVSASVTVPTTFTRLLMPTMTVTRSSTVTLGNAGSTSSSTTTTTGVTKTVTTVTPARTACISTLDMTAALSFGVNTATSFDASTCSEYDATDASTTYITGLATYPSTATTGNVVTGSSTVPATGKVCILLKETSAQALLFNSSVTINAPNCEIDVMSTGNPAVMSNSPTLTLAKLCVAGSNVTQNGTAIPSSILSKNCTTASDPFAGTLPSVSSSTVSTCTYSNVNYSGTASLSPGTYCGNFNFNGTGTLNLAAGLYVFNNTHWNLNSGWTVSGTGVTFYFADSNSYIQFNSGVTAHLSAPTTGTYSGILMYEPTTITNKSSFAVDDSAHTLSGLIYLPSRNVTLNSAVNATAENLTMVFNTLIFDSGTNLNLSYATTKNITAAGTTTVTTTTTNPYGAWFNSASTVSFDTICSHAGYNLSLVNGTNSCSRITDPFSGNLPTVTAAACTSGNTYSSGSAAFTPTAAGTFCGYPTFTGTIPAGLYVIATPAGNTASQLVLNNVTGPGVTFYVADTNATINVTGAAKGITAPTSGLYEGILLFMPSTFTTKQLVSWSNLTNTGFTTSGTPAMSGLIYAPSWNIAMNTWTNGYFAVTLVANATVLSSFSSITWRPSARTIYVSSAGTAVASYTTATTTTSTTTTSTVAGTSSYISQ